MQPEQFVTPQAVEYARQASGGAAQAAGMAPYPLYGLPYGMGQAEPEVPFYRRPLVCFSAGALLVGAAWAYFGWWRPRQAAAVKKNGEE